MLAKISKCLCWNPFIGTAAQIRAVYKDHETLVTLKRCITLSLSFESRYTNFLLFYDCHTDEKFFVYLKTVQIRTRKEYKVHLILETVWTSWYSALLCNICKCNHLVIIVGEFVWDNCFQIMFVINILTLQSLLLYHFYTFIPYITRPRLLLSHWSSPQVWSLTFHNSQLL